MKKLFYHTPLLLLFVFFSIQGYGQAEAEADTTKKTSKSPLLDKYYTRPKEDTVATKTVIKSTGVEQKTVKTPAPVKQAPIEEKRLAFPTPERPAIATTPTAPEIAPLPAPVIASADSISTVVAEAPVKILPVAEPPVTTPLSKSTIVADTKISMPVTDSSKITRPVITIAATVPPKIAVTKPEGFKRPRLGSSSPLYNTYEKNNNGAGSVTTLPKN